MDASRRARRLVHESCMYNAGFKVRFFARPRSVRVTHMTERFRLSIHKDIFTKLPGLQVFIAVVRNLDPQRVDKEGCKELLAKEWAHCRKLVASYPNVQSHPYLASWRRAYATLGIPSKKFTTSIENLCKRALKPDSEPRSINPLVDLYNACSLKFVTPFGGFDMADPTVKDLDFRFTTEGDMFHALDAEKPEPMASGEAAYASGHTVLTRHINWKQSKEGLIGEDSKDVVFMAELLGDMPSTLIAEMSEFFEAQSKHLLGVSPEIHVVSESNPSVYY